MKSYFDSLVILVILGITLEDVLCLTCHDCSRITHPADCGHVMECEANSACSVQEIITDSGISLFNVGCRTLQRCGAHKKRQHADDIQEDYGDLIVCDDCCHSDFCNNKGCGSNLLSNIMDRGPICFDCPEFDIFCDNVKQCSSNQVCFLSPVQTVSGEQLKAECRPSQVCDTLSTLTDRLGRRDLQTCTGCCRTDYCNRDCSTVQTILHSHATHSVGSTFSPTHTTANLLFQTSQNIITTTPPDSKSSQNIITTTPPDSTSSQNIITTTPPDNTQCVDTIDNCANYAQDVCTRAEYRAWALARCRAHCKLCPPATTTTSPTTTTPTLCVNRAPNCYAFDTNVCTGSLQAWMHDNCRKFCGKC